MKFALFILPPLICPKTFAVVSTAGEAVSARFRKEILMENGPIGVLEIFSEEPADAVYEFGKLHDLDENQRHNLLDSICASISCQRKQALLWSAPVVLNDDQVELFQVFEGTEVVDKVHSFIKQHNLDERYRNAIMKEACTAIQCSRTEPGKMQHFTA